MSDAAFPDSGFARNDGTAARREEPLVADRGIKEQKDLRHPSPHHFFGIVGIPIPGTVVFEYPGGNSNKESGRL